VFAWCESDSNAAQVVWWGVFSKRYEDEVAAQAEVFGGEAGAARFKALRLRVTEHNVLVVAKYYSRLTLARLAELLDLPVEEARPIHARAGHCVSCLVPTC
jgi:hypothetical protein